jgi:hypothetical protein
MPAICFRGISGRRLLGGNRELLDRLANNFELPNHGILAHPLGHERVAAHRRVPLDIVDSVAL